MATTLLAPARPGPTPREAPPASRTRLAGRLAIAGPVLLAAVVIGYQLALPHVLFGYINPNSSYDDGVYFGAIVRLAHGSIPYRDFTYPQPPGSVVLLSPIGFLTRLVGAGAGLAVARGVTAVVSVGNVALAALAARRRGPVASTVAGLALACFPFSVYVDHSMRVDPYLVFFCLLGLVLLVGEGDAVSRRRLVLGGLALGVAGSIKLWAAAVILAAAAVLIWRIRRAAAPLVAGMVAGFTVPCAPFFLAAPGAFVRDVLTSQLTRTAPYGDLSIVQRLTWIAGLPGLSTVTDAIAVALAVVVAAFVAVAFVADREHLDVLSWLALAAAAAAVAEMDLPPEFYNYYPYFPVALLAVLLGVSAGHLAAAVRRRPSRAPGGPRWPAWMPGAAILTLTGTVVAIFLPATIGLDDSYLATTRAPSGLISATIPAGACAVTDVATLLIEADRFESTVKGCPQLIDPFDMFLTYDGGQAPPAPPPYPASFVRRWQDAFGRASYAVLTPESGFIPWTASLRRWFAKRFRLVARNRSALIYKRTASA